MGPQIHHNVGRYNDFLDKLFSALWHHMSYVQPTLNSEISFSKTGGHTNIAELVCVPSELISAVMTKKEINPFIS